MSGSMPLPEDDPPRFLLVDDHSVVRRGVLELLKEHFPMAIYGEAGTAQKALEQAWSHPWDVIILDISMPGRSGLDILRELKQARPRAAILVQSMFAEDQFAQRVFKAGASGYITKDSLPSDLLRAVERVMSGHRYVSESLAEQLAGSLASEGRAMHERLSDREYQVFRMLAGGQALKEIAAELSLSVKTISTYRARILEKMALHSNAELVQYAIKASLLT
jgi:DNA-binding NarL/FixJ family response regulator